MDVFLQIVCSFPTAIYTVLLGVAVIYWLLAALGIAEIDGADTWLSLDIDEHFDIDGSSGFAGLLLKFGLGGLPIMLIATVLLFVAWILSYFADYLLLRHLPFELTRWLLDSMIAIAAFVAAVPVTSVTLRPLRRWFSRLRPAASRSLLGQVAVVRSPEVDTGSGSANVENGGAGLILQVRSDRAMSFKRGDRVVLIEYLAEQNAYRAIGEDEFQGL